MDSKISGCLHPENGKFLLKLSLKNWARGMGIPIRKE
jgi:hypothetical protein